MHDFFDNEDESVEIKMVKMKAISLKQPWANLVMDKKKIIETRTWKTNYRGELVICSSAKPDFVHVHPDIDREPMGYALGTVEVYDIVRMNRNHEKDAMCKLYDGAYAWLLRNIRQFKKPIPIKGQLNIFQIELPFNEIKFK
jgi:hypothetical protein